MHHLMGDKYIPFLNNQLLELCDPGREKEREKGLLAALNPTKVR